jgi:hypothetical protein
MLAAGCTAISNLVASGGYSVDRDDRPLSGFLFWNGILLGFITILLVVIIVK